MVVDILIGSGLFVALVGIFGTMIKYNRDNERKINRTYQRLDEVKKEAKEEFVNRDLCKVITEQFTRETKEIKEIMAREFIEIKTDIKAILKNGQVKPR